MNANNFIAPFLLLARHLVRTPDCLTMPRTNPSRAPGGAAPRGLSRAPSHPRGPRGAPRPAGQLLTINQVGGINAEGTRERRYLLHGRRNSRPLSPRPPPR